MVKDMITTIHLLEPGTVKRGFDISTTFRGLSIDTNTRQLGDAVEELGSESFVAVLRMGVDQIHHVMRVGPALYTDLFLWGEGGGGKG